MIIVETNILRVAVFSRGACIVYATGGARDTRPVGTVVPRGTVVVDVTYRRVTDANVIRADFVAGTIAVDVTAKRIPHTHIVDT